MTDLEQSYPDLPALREKHAAAVAALGGGNPVMLTNALITREEAIQVLGGLPVDVATHDRLARANLEAWERGERDVVTLHALNRVYWEVWSRETGEEAMDDQMVINPAMTRDALVIEIEEQGPVTQFPAMLAERLHAIAAGTHAQPAMLTAV